MKKVLLFLSVFVIPWIMAAQTTTVGAGATITINDGGTLKTGDITIEKDNGAPTTYGMITVNSGGSLTADNVTNNNGYFRFLVESSGNKSGSVICDAANKGQVNHLITENEWHLIAASTSDVESGDYQASGGQGTSWLSEFLTAGNDWSYITSTVESMPRGKGYSYWIDDPAHDTKAVNKGDFIGSDLDVSLATNTNGDNWNLLGNPYPSAMDWSLQQDKSDLAASGAAYVWDNSQNGYLYTTYGTGTSGTLPGDIIPIGQGFFVKAATAGTFTIEKGTRVHNFNDFVKSGSADEGEVSQYIRMDVDGGYYGNTVFVGFPEIGTDEIDRGDTYKLYSSTENIQFFAVENGEELCVNANKPLSEGKSKTVPLYIAQTKENSHSLVFSELDQLPNTAITLEDLKTGQTQDIRKNREYQFTTSSNDDAHRFNLHFAWAPNSINNAEDVASNIQIYSYSKEVYIRSTNQAVNQSGEVFVYDMMGRKLTQQHINHGELAKVTINANNAYVVVKVIKEGFVKNEKVFIK